MLLTLQGIFCAQHSSHLVHASFASACKASQGSRTNHQRKTRQPCMTCISSAPTLLPNIPTRGVVAEAATPHKKKYVTEDSWLLYHHHMVAVLIT